ncbi:hypothetical protein J3E72DRAFT_267433 [Bipolaris maydis]|nr:hypothetical protein J3E72DRAFT_267433 [Bipolaris maydis]
MPAGILTSPTSKSEYPISCLTHASHVPAIAGNIIVSSPLLVEGLTIVRSNFSSFFVYGNARNNGKKGSGFSMRRWSPTPPETIESNDETEYAEKEKAIEARLEDEDSDYQNS